MAWAFGTNYNNLRTGQDNTQRRKEEALFKTTRTHESIKHNNEIFKGLVSTDKSGYLSSVGGYNVKSHDLLLNIKKGAANALNPYIEISDISNHIIVDASCNKQACTTAPNSAFELFEGPFLLIPASLPASLQTVSQCLSSEASRYTNYDVSNIDPVVVFPFNQLVRSDIQGLKLRSRVLIKCTNPTN
jgi:hypothetical protein